MSEIRRWAAKSSLWTQVNRVPVWIRRLLVVGWDVFAWVAGVALWVFGRLEIQDAPLVMPDGLIYLGLAIPLQLLGGFGLRLYLGRSRVGSFEEATLLAVLTASIGLFLAAIFTLTPLNVPRGLMVAAPGIAVIIVASGRWMARVLRAPIRIPNEDSPKAIVFGAGEIGHQVAHLVKSAAEPPFQVVGFVDDSPSKRHLRVHGFKVLGTSQNLIEVAHANQATKVVLAISEIKPEFIQDLSTRCKDAGLKLVVVPPVREMVGGRMKLNQIRDINVDDLLGRRPIETNVKEVAGYLTDKVVLITGAGGSIGSELAAQVHAFNPKKLILLDRDESGLHTVQLNIYQSGLLDTDDMVLCDIRDEQALQAVFDHHRPEVVFHAAALKHLPMLEQYPLEGWKTNVQGSLNVLQCAHRVGVQRFVNISTDKAADPTSVLGRTKRAAERLTAWYAKQYQLPYVSVRFGNVLGSRGSVLFTFRSQINQGGPVTITHPEITRYFMTIPEACELVLQAGAIGDPGEVMVLDMGTPVKIADVAQRLIEESGRRDITVKYTGLRDGEKMHEVLLSDVEDAKPSDHPLITKVEVEALKPEVLPDVEDTGVILDVLNKEGVIAQAPKRPILVVSERIPNEAGIAS